LQKGDSGEKMKMKKKMLALAAAMALSCPAFALKGMAAPQPNAMQMLVHMTVKSSSENGANDPAHQALMALHKYIGFQSNEIKAKNGEISVLHGILETQHKAAANGASINKKDPMHKDLTAIHQYIALQSAEIQIKNKQILVLHGLLENHHKISVTNGLKMTGNQVQDAAVAMHKFIKLQSAEIQIKNDEISVLHSLLAGKHQEN
jgi:hypothetical protein